ncbi:MAG: hypothetical protein C4541_13015 [Candidatus Auribacter fodinae]|jgi:hypothetical protein|uniref:Uncharacterized protein n=1 Tax=Candidatus Auribacter fodinae TaxID=2093366 RepID=A0A3A4QTY8_9BACT|nr:MAG: hypothetical protein C4541_13015 [Candidatus Auribacter fodinae]
MDKYAKLVLILYIMLLCASKAGAVNLNQTQSSGSVDTPAPSVSPGEVVSSRPLQLALPEPRKLEIPYQHVRDIAARINRVNIPEPTLFLRGVDRGYTRHDYSLQDSLLQRRSILQHDELRDTGGKYLTDVLREVTSVRTWGRMPDDRSDNWADEFDREVIEHDPAPEPYREYTPGSSPLYTENKWVTTYSLHQPPPIVHDMNDNKLDTQIVMLSDQAEAVPTDSAVYKPEPAAVTSGPRPSSQPDNAFLLTLPPEIEQVYLANNCTASEDVEEYNIVFRFFMFIYESMQSFVSFIGNLFS